MQHCRWREVKRQSLLVSKLPSAMCNEVSQPLEGTVTIHLTPHFHRNGQKKEGPGDFHRKLEKLPL